MLFEGRRREFCGSWLCWWSEIWPCHWTKTPLPRRPLPAALETQRTRIVCFCCLVLTPALLQNSKHYKVNASGECKFSISVHWKACYTISSVTRGRAQLLNLQFCFRTACSAVGPFWVITPAELLSLNLRKLDNTEVFSCVKAIFATGVPLVEGKGINFRRWLKNIQFAHRLAHSNLPSHACRCLLLSESSRHFCSIKFTVTVALNTTGTVITTATIVTVTTG
jgi:hypothetical protein